MPALTPGSDEWWMVRLAKALGEEEKRLHELDQWGAGTPPLPVELPDLVKPHYRRLLEISRVHLADLPVTALSRRLLLVSFRTAAPGDEDGDKDAEKMWAKCSFSDLKRWAIQFGRSYTRVEKVGGEVFVTAESPRQTITEQDPLRPGEALAALKIYRDAANDRDVAVLDRPGYQRVAYRQGTRGLLPGQGRSWRFNLTSWELQDVKVDTGLARNAVTLFDLEDGIGRYEKHLPTLRRINHTIVQRMVLIALQAFRQRALKGAPKTDPLTGEDVDYDKIFSGDPGQMWILPQAVELWESGQADFTPVLNAVKDDVRFFAVGTGTPIHILQPDAANGSAEGAALLREQLVFDAEDTIERWRPRAARTLASAFALAGEQARADEMKIESIWAAPQRESLQARASATVQMKAAGVPWAARMEIGMQARPSQIRRWAQQRTTDAFLGDDVDSDPADEPAAVPASVGS
jgi:hypothetical protein